MTSYDHMIPCILYIVYIIVEDFGLIRSLSLSFSSQKNSMEFYDLDASFIVCNKKVKSSLHWYL